MEVQQTTKSARTGWRAAFLIAIAILGTYLFFTTRSTLWDRDEPRFSRATVEMVESGNYLYPTFNGALRPDKPILIYWLMSIPVRLLGPTELACRFFSALGTAVTCLLTFYIGKQLWNTKTGLWAMAILGTSAMMLFEGTAATADGTLLPLMVATMAIFVHALKAGPQWRHAVGMGVTLGLALLTKGPVGLLPVLTILTLIALERKGVVRPGRHVLNLLIALVLATLIFIAWGIPANNATHGEFYRLAVGHHVVGRSLKPLEGHGGSRLLFLFYYLPVIIAGFFPWTLHLPGAFSAALRRRLPNPQAGRLLLAWIVPTFILMTLVATKLPHYVLFMWPALALVTAVTLTESGRRAPTDRDRDWLRGGIWFFAPVAVPLALGLILAPWFLKIPALRWPGLVAGLALAGMAGAVIRRQLQDRFYANAKGVLAGMVLFLVCLFVGVMPAIETLKIPPTLARAITTQTPSDTPVAAHSFREPSLNFYIGRPIETLGNEDEIVQWTRRPGPGVLIIPRRILDDIQQRHGTLPLAEIAAKQGLNYSKGKPREIVALLRKDPTP